MQVLKIREEKNLYGHIQWGSPSYCKILLAVKKAGVSKGVATKFLFSTPLVDPPLEPSHQLHPPKYFVTAPQLHFHYLAPFTRGFQLASGCILFNPDSNGLDPNPMRPEVS